jgi:hypothetical protein
MLQALADGETDPAALAALADTRLRATPAQLRDAVGHQNLSRNKINEICSTKLMLPSRYGT